MPERRGQALGAFLAEYLARRAGDLKGSTLTARRTTVNDLAGFFGAGCPLRDISETRADDFKAHLQARGLAAATVARRLRATAQFFAYAVRSKLLPASPFAGVTAVSVVPEENNHYVTPADAARLLEGVPPGLAGHGRPRPVRRAEVPVRGPAAPLGNVDLPGGRMTVDSPKTEHHPGGAYRVVPIFPELRPFLEAAWELAGPGDVYVVAGDLADRPREKAKGKQGWTGVSLATRLAKLIRRAGLEVWPRPFHNLRASRETDLMARFPIHVVCRWIGNTPAIALRHYVQDGGRLRPGQRQRAQRRAADAESDVDPGGLDRTRANKKPGTPCRSPGWSEPVR